MSPVDPKPAQVAQEPIERYWRSTADLENKPEFLKYIQKEFPEQEEQFLDPLSRRRFMQLMGASFAFASASGCRRWEEEHVVPLGRRPEDYVPGNAVHFATAMEVAGVAQPLLAKSVDGRPIKIEGNKEHPASGGASSSFAQASVLELYDPDRSRTVVHRDAEGQRGSKNRADFEKQLVALSKQLKSRRGQNLHVIAEASSSATMERLRKEFQSQFPSARWHEYESLSRDNELAGTQQAFGSPHRAVYRLGQAKTILTVDADLFVHHPDAIRNAREFGQSRRPTLPPAGQARGRNAPSPMSRLYAVESVFTTTGAAADHRLPLRSELCLPFLLRVEAELPKFLRGASVPANQAGNTQFGAANDDYSTKFITEVARDLAKAGRRGIVCVGARQSPAAHAVAARINALIGAAGSTVAYIAEKPRPSHKEAIVAASTAIAKNAQTVIIIGGNPVYDAPANAKLGESLAAFHKRGGVSIHLSIYDNETSAACSWHVPRAHYLESWGDSRSWDGIATLTQPLLAPLYDGISSLQFVDALVGGRVRSGKGLVQETYAQSGGPRWNSAVHAGFVTDGRPPIARPPVVPEFKSANVPLTDRQKKGGPLGNGDLEIAFTHSNQVFDGRYANSSWLHEIPDFMTKSVWDNYAMVSPATAHSLGVENNTIIKLTLGNEELKIPLYVMPGQAPHSVAVALGYGRTHAGMVGGLTEATKDGDESVRPVGVNVGPLRNANNFFFGGGLKVGKTGESFEIGNTQDHFAIDKTGREALEGRLPQLIKEANFDEYKADPKFAQKVPGPSHESLWKEHKYDGYKWGMATDLGSCIGCNSCVVACQAENNIPVVGKKEVLNHREMQWLRLDRYFKGDKNNPEVVGQPVTCQHCEKAPCEQVCPVGATVHSSEGLNDMVYNRCVGTRYCLNNCPYKVRRFNFFDYHKGLEAAKQKVRKLLFNPDVTVRSRGVMEKCTFCVQRIQEAKITAHNERRRVGEVKGKPEAYREEVTTACQEACPTGAIVFGDLNNEKSRVAALHRDNRAYALLAEYETVPRNLYLARIKNPNPNLVAPKKADKGHH